MRQVPTRSNNCNCFDAEDAEVARRNAEDCNCNSNSFEARAICRPERSEGPALWVSIHASRSVDAHSQGFSSVPSVILCVLCVETLLQEPFDTEDTEVHRGHRGRQLQQQDLLGRHPAIAMRGCRPQSACSCSPPRPLRYLRALCVKSSCRYQIDEDAGDRTPRPSALASPA